MSGSARLPWRRVILASCSVGIVALVVLGSYQTLTLPEGQRYTPELWANFTVEGLSQGAIYALLAVGYSLVYGIMRLINFAHGEVFMAGAFASFFFADAFVRSGSLDARPSLAIAILFLVSISVSCLVALLLARIVYRPLRAAPPLVPLIAAIGASLFLQSTARGFFGSSPRAYPLPEVLDGVWAVGFVTILRIQALVVVVAIASVIGLRLVVTRTRVGNSMHAMSEGPQDANPVGTGVEPRVITTTFLVAGALAGIAGVLFAMLSGSVDPFMGFEPGIAALTAAVLGGFGSIGGVALGGLVVGVLRSVGPALILTGFGVPSPFGLRDAFVFATLVCLLILRADGSLGSGVREHG